LQLIGKKKKKTLVLTLGRSGAYTANSSEKGEKKKKNLSVCRRELGDFRQHQRWQFRAKKKKKPMSICRQELGDFRQHRRRQFKAGNLKKKKKKKTLVLTLGRPPNLDFKT
jgi:hypothetical protein